MRGLLGISNAIDAFLGTIAKLFAWLLPVLVVVIVFDVITRKFGFQLNLFGIDLGSTRLQEMEWHLHSMLFLTWIGYCYVRNVHVRIDVATGGLSQRSQAWLELFGCIVFAFPYILTTLPYAMDFFLVSFFQNESSSAPNGLPWRWIPKGFLFFCFISILLAVISVFIRRFVFLFGSAEVSNEAMPVDVKAIH